MDLQMNIMQPLYGGLDLHGNNVFCSLVDTARKIVAEIRLPNDIARIREWLQAHGSAGEIRRTLAAKEADGVFRQFHV